MRLCGLRGMSFYSTTLASAQQIVHLHNAESLVWHTLVESMSCLSLLLSLKCQCVCICRHYI